MSKFGAKPRAAAWRVRMRACMLWRSRRLTKRQGMLRDKEAAGEPRACKHKRSLTMR